MGTEEQILLDRIFKSVGDYSVYIEYDANQDPVYMGEAVHGSSKLNAVWRIRKVTYDANHNPTSVLWAEGTTAFNKIWNGRGAYLYS